MERCWYLLVLIFTLICPLAWGATALDAHTLAQWRDEGVPILLLDARAEEVYLAGHRPSAVSFDVADTYRVEDGVWRAKSIGEMTREIRLRGVDPGVALVIYDDGTLLDAARLAWVLELYGLSRVHILTEPLAADQLETAPVAPAPSDYLPALNPDALADARMTLLAGHNPSFVIVDNRPRAHYLGQQSETDKFGHIPGAISIPMERFFTEDKPGQLRLRSWQELMRLFDALDPDKRYITYCYQGKASTLGYFLMQQAGLKVTHYDGSWLDWSSRDLPVERTQ